MAELKTFLFTDIVGSVELKRAMPGHSDTERDRAFIEQILTPHRARIERELEALDGRVVSTAGDGHFLVFTDTVLAARWAIGIQTSHRDDPINTPAGRPVAVRMSMHLGNPQIDPHHENNFVGKAVDYAARLNDFATGEQILVSRTVVSILEDAGMDGISFHHHGNRELKGIGKVEVYELVYDSSGPRKMRPQPREDRQEMWTVLPATVGLTEFYAASRRHDQGSGTAVAPRKLGNYELTERLGGGGMGDVYKARHLQFGRQRAVKVIKRHFVESQNKEVIDRFYQEIKAVGALEHPNIVVAIDSSTSEGAGDEHYLVMEYIDGVSADELVERIGPVPVAEACEIIRQAARGLAYIHQNGMVHRDIKPSNLMLTIVTTDASVSDTDQSAEPDGQKAVVKILDLGLALLVGEDQQRLTVFDDRPMGTAMYMSPEQWKTTSVDIRADIYSLGCTLYHLLSGKPPFWDSDLRPERAHEREALRPIVGPYPIPPAVWSIVQKMTAKRPDDRFANPIELVAALAPWTKGRRLVPLIQQAMGNESQQITQPQPRSDTRVRTGKSDTIARQTPPNWNLPTPVPSTSNRSMRRIVLAAVGLLAAGVLGWFAIQSVSQSDPAIRQQILQLAAASGAGEIGDEIKVRFQRIIALAANEELRDWMIQIDAAGDDQTLWEPLQKPLSRWLGSEKANFDEIANSESWFITNRLGLQVSRSPWSEDSIGRNYAYRDYFHGKGADEKEGTTDVPPISSPHLCAVYRSTSTQRLKVAFSAPIYSGKSGADKTVLGILAMSVDLGEFNVLEKVLRRDRGQEVVLFDLRRDYLDEGQPNRGLILHHTRAESFEEDMRPVRINSELLDQIKKVLAEADRASSQTRNLLLDYEDPLSTKSKRKFWGALERVTPSESVDDQGNSGWVVLVQEPAAQ